MPEGGDSVVAGYLPGVAVKPLEIVGVDHHAHCVLCSYARHGGHYLVGLLKIPVGCYQRLDHLVALLYRLVQLGYHVLALPGHEALGWRAVQSPALLALADDVAASLAHVHLSEQEQLPELRKWPAERLVQCHSVVVPHCVLGYHGSVCTVALEASYAAAVLDALRVLKPHVAPLAVEEVRQPLAVVARVLSAEKPQRHVHAVRVHLHPFEELTVAGLVVCKLFVHPWSLLLQILSHDDDHVKFFF